MGILKVTAIKEVIATPSAKYQDHRNDYPNTLAYELFITSTMKSEFEPLDLPQSLIYVCSHSFPLIRTATSDILTNKICCSLI